MFRKIFNVGPFEVSGSNEVINNQMFDYTNDKIYVVKGARPLEE
jgi:penicillin amidase